MQVLSVCLLLPPLAKPTKVISMLCRRSDLQHEILTAQLTMILCCIHELMQYGVYLRCAPHSAAALTVPNADINTIKVVLGNLEKEWRTVERMEQTEYGRACLNRHCKYIQYQQYREVMGVLDMFSFTLHETVLQTLGAWCPKMNASSNIEQIFNDMSWAIKKSGKPDCGSLSSLMSVAVRGLQRRVCSGPNVASPVALVDSDFAGKETQGLKSKIWSPAAAVPSHLFGMLGLLLFPSLSH